MTLHILPITENKTIKLWNLTDTDAMVQCVDSGKKSRKSKATIKYYNDKPYIMCCGHRYYIDKFRKIEI